MKRNNTRQIVGEYLVVAAMLTLIALPTFGQGGVDEAETVRRIREQLGPHYDARLDIENALIVAVGIKGLTAADTEWDIEHAFAFAQTVFGSQDVAGDWVGLIATPRDEFVQIVGQMLGGHGQGNFHSVGGFYDRDKRRLITTALGPNLRHELVHVAHHRDMIRLEQSHPIWIQEGIASLAEDLGSDGLPVANWRTNIATRLANGRGIGSLEKLAALEPAAFTGKRPLANYARVRGVFLYMSQTGKLGDWYSTYTSNAEHGFGIDPTGIAALEAVFDAPIKAFERELDDWLENLEKVPEETRPGAPTLGLRLANEQRGLVVTGRERPRSLVPLGVGDTLMAIDGVPVRELPELIRIIGTYEAGDQIEVSVRRGTVERVEPVVLGKAK